MGTELPIIFMTAHGDIPMTVQAMKAGAVEFLTKPCRDQDLLDSVRLALAHDRERRAKAARVVGLKADFATLTGREKEVIGVGDCGTPQQTDRWRNGCERGHGEDASWQHHSENACAHFGRSHKNGRSFGRHERQAWITLDLSILFFALPIAQPGETQRSTRGVTGGALPDFCSGEQELVKTPMIAIVDDDGAVRESTRALVRSLGYNASTFSSAEEFLEPIRVILAV